MLSLIKVSVASVFLQDIHCPKPSVMKSNPTQRGQFNVFVFLPQLDVKITDIKRMVGKSPE